MSSRVPASPVSGSTPSPGATPRLAPDVGTRFISYAQNFEDVMLARALGDVETGFYIDVGAQDPDEGSVYKAFLRPRLEGPELRAVRELPRPV